MLLRFGRDEPAVRDLDPRDRTARFERDAQVCGAGRHRVVERVTDWEDGRAVGLELEQHDWPVEFMRWVTRIEPHDGGTRITQSLEYKVKFGPLGWLLDALMMKRTLRANLDKVFASLVRHAESATTEANADARS